MMNMAQERGVLLVVNWVKLFITASVLGLILVGLLGCSSSSSSPQPQCPTGFVLPAGYPATVDGFYGLVFNTCDYSQAEMNRLRKDMKRAGTAVMACLDTTYGYDFQANSKDGIGFPYASKVQIVPTSFTGHDGKVRDIQYLQAGYFVKYHPVKKPDGTWDMYRWVGELHTMYRVEMLGSWDHSVVYNEDLPFAGAASLAARTCIDSYKP